MRVCARTIVAWIDEASYEAAAREISERLKGLLAVSEVERHDEDMLERRDDPDFTEPPDTRGATWVVWMAEVMADATTCRITEIMESSPAVKDFEIHLEDMLQREEWNG